MKRFVYIIPLMLAFFLIFLSGCGSPQAPQGSPLPQSSQPQDPASVHSISSLGGNTTPSIGGICLGDSTDKVNRILDSEFSILTIDDGGYFGEPYQERTYPNGLKIIIGKSSSLVLQIMSTAPNLPTDLGIKIGDGSDRILRTYRANYKEPVSQHGSGQLFGWFDVGNDQLMIFDFDADDESMVNKEIKPDSKVERIILAYSNFMD